MGLPDQAIDLAREWREIATGIHVRERTQDGMWSTVAEVDPDEFWADAETAEAALQAFKRSLRVATRSFFVGEPRLLRIPASGPLGFDVEIYASTDRIHGWFGGLTQCFAGLDSAMAWARCAIDGYELEIRSYGGVPKEWCLRSTSAADGRATIASGSAVPFRWLRQCTVSVRRNRYRAIRARSEPHPQDRVPAV